MNYLYVLRCKSEKTFYIGSTNDLKRRLEQHNAGLNKSTAGRQWELVYYEAYVSLEAARERELSLKKHGRVKQLLLQRIRRSLN